MQNPIQKIGHLMQVDGDGYLVNECRWDAIKAPWLELVESLRSLCVENCDRIHSIYLRGSVPRGQAILNVSDLDSIVIIQGEITPDLGADMLAIEEQLEKQYPFCQKVEISIASDDEVQSSGSYWQALLQTQGLCIYGEDLRSQFPRFAPSHAMISHAFDLADDLAEAKMILRQLSPTQLDFESTISQKCRWICKRLVRTGFELVMIRDRSFSRDLYPCYARFAHYYPDQAQLMYKALELAIQPSSNRDGLLLFLNHLGTWLVERVEMDIDLN
jgi:hypothetical protein